MNQHNNDVHSPPQINPNIDPQSFGCQKPWSGKIAVLRTYDQPSSTGNRVFVYLEAGENADYVGNTEDPHIIDALYLCHIHKRPVSGYTNSVCRIEWMSF